MVNEIDIFMGGFDTGKTPHLQQYDTGRKFLWHLWEKPGVPFEMEHDAVVGVVFDGKGAPPSHEYKADVVDKSTLRITVPAAATKRKGPLDVQVLIHQNDGVLYSPVICTMVLHSLDAADTETDEPVMLTDWLLKKARETADRVEQMEIDASGIAGDSNKLGGKPPKDYLLANGTAADAALLAGKAPEYYIQPRNLLDNSDFGNPVAQAGHNGFHGNNLYPIDRWMSWSSEIEVGDGYIKPNTPIDQNLNPADIDTNKVYTLAIKLLDGTVVCNTGTFAASFGTYATCFAGTDNGRIFVRIGENQKVVWTALYEGEYTADTLPPYVPKGYAAELAECQRYACVIGEGNWLTGFHVIGHGLVVPLELPALRAHNTPSAECAAQAYIGTDGWVDITFRHLGYDYVTGVVHNIIFEPPAELQSGEVCIVSGIKGLFSDL